MQSNGGHMSMGDKVIMSAIIGGGKPARRSVCEGGFANGAVTGAYVMMLNHLGEHGNRYKEGKNAFGSKGKNQKPEFRE